MKNIVFLCSLLLTMIGATTLPAQINIGGSPYSFTNAVSNQVPTRTMPGLDMLTIQEEDELDERGGQPPRFGYPLRAGFNTENSGNWETLPNGDRLWRLTIKCPGARSINLLYNEFWLPKDATVYIYNRSRQHVIGGFTERNNNAPRGERLGYATGLVYGDEITIELYEPAEAEAPAIIDINQVVHGYRHIDIEEETRAFGDSGNCQININCTAGNNYQGAKTSVALILVGGTRWCTGSLMNAAGDFQPYLLTADHCLDGWAIPTALDAVSNPHASTWSFMWNYESPTCANPASEPTNFQTTVGAVIAANKGDSDFALLRLKEDPFRDAGMSLQYNGWDVSAPGAGGGGVHHPSGDIKKVSLYTQTPWNNHGCAPNNTWSVIFQHSAAVFTTTEGGSSGSPLYDDAGRVVGQLWGGANPNGCGNGPTCGNPSQDMSYYGKFGVSWDDAGGSKRRLKDWLGPTCNTNYTVSSNIVNEVPAYYATDRVTSNRTISGSYAHVTFNGGDEVVLTDGFRVSGSAQFRATNFNCGGSLSPDGGAEGLRDGVIVYPTEEGYETIAVDHDNIAALTAARVAETILPSVADRDDHAGHDHAALTTGLRSQPNPFGQWTTISFDLEADAPVTIQIQDVAGKVVKSIRTQEMTTAGTHSIELDLADLPNGQFYCTLMTDAGRETIKLVKMN